MLFPTSSVVSCSVTFLFYTRKNKIKALHPPLIILLDFERDHYIGTKFRDAKFADLGQFIVDNVPYEDPSIRPPFLIQIFKNYVHYKERGIN